MGREEGAPTETPLNTGITKELQHTEAWTYGKGKFEYPPTVTCLVVYLFLNYMHIL